MSLEIAKSPKVFKEHPIQMIDDEMMITCHCRGVKCRVEIEKDSLKSQRHSKYRSFSNDFITARDSKSDKVQKALSEEKLFPYHRHASHDSII
jgi:hypothetical protein